MNRKEFEQEVLQSNICPENFKIKYEEFRHFQDEAIKTLNEFHRVCEKNNIQYQLAFGSLLGAVRDNGQIPWDYDIDVIVPYDEKDKLVHVLKYDLDPAFYFHCPEQDKKCRHFIMRLAPKGYKTTLLHVDVFYTIGVSEDETERNMLEKEIQKLFHFRYYKLVKYEDVRTFKSKIKALIYKLLLTPLSVSAIEKKMKYLCKKYDHFNSKYCIVVQGDYRNKYFLTNKLWDTKLYNTEIGTFRISRHYDYILKVLYKDYNTIFPLKNRLNEMLLHYSLLTGRNVKLKSTSDKIRYYMDDEDLS